MSAATSGHVLFYMLLAISIVALGAYGLYRLRDPIRRLIAVNLMGSGTFLIMVALARRAETPDPVLHALVVTGLVVAVCATAFALRLITASADQPGADSPERD